ncbi:outer membrane protein OmpK [Zestomonas thermotolerans]|jgi:nucleoside-specific outer membrane channel protein Tsx|uniref:outer membrane protein OmpK n=1 Tax=Zestomonas thermotolerans TaxID=157784 RepID=UPI000489C3E1|nr:outer membrane protein OmpK [Pseudomonas thermotolerans]
MNRAVKSLALAGGLLAASQATAGDLLQWQDNSLTFLWGKDFQVNPPVQQTWTFEHASGWSWGDLFIFIDQINYQGTPDGQAGKDTYYGEISPRLSFGKISGADLSFGPIKDVLLAATYERGENSNQVYLLGPGFDLNIPGFDYFQLNFYYRKPDGISGQPKGQWQVTPAWSYTLPVGNSDLVIDGYIDYVWNNKDGSSNRPTDMHANLHVNPQIKYDLGKALSWTAVKKFYVGVEYDYWSDKYAIEDSQAFRTDQSALSFLAKVHF